MAYKGLEPNYPSFNITFPKHSICFCSGWVLSGEMWEGCCNNQYTGDKDALLGHCGFECSQSEMVWEGRSCAPGWSKEPAAPKLSVLKYFVFTSSNAKSKWYIKGGNISYLHERGHPIRVLPHHYVKASHQAGSMGPGLTLLPPGSF